VPTVSLGNYKKVNDLAGKPALIVVLWELASFLTLRNRLCASSGLKKVILTAFGAKIGHGVVIKQSVAVKYPWKLTIGANSWIGEGVWIDNMAGVDIGDDVCVSQGAYLCTGNHDWSKSDFPLKARPITVENGVWIGARAIVCPGMRLATHSVVTAGSVVTQNTQSYKIYQGNPAVFVKDRKIG